MSKENPENWRGWRPATNKSDPSTWKSKKNARGGMTRIEREADRPRRMSIIENIAVAAMTYPSPFPTREELRERCIRGLLAIAEADGTVDETGVREKVDARARATAFKAVLDHTDKVADREQDYSKLSDAEVQARVLEHARKLVAQHEATPQLPEVTGAEETEEELG